MKCNHEKHTFVVGNDEYCATCFIAGEQRSREILEELFKDNEKVTELLRLLGGKSK